MAVRDEFFYDIFGDIVLFLPGLSAGKKCLRIAVYKIFDLRWNEQIQCCNLGKLLAQLLLVRAAFFGIGACVRYSVLGLIYAKIPNSIFQNKNAGAVYFDETWSHKCRMVYLLEGYVCELVLFAYNYPNRISLWLCERDDVFHKKH